MNKLFPIVLALVTSFLFPDKIFLLTSRGDYPSKSDEIRYKSSDKYSVYINIPAKSYGWKSRDVEIKCNDIAYLVNKKGERIETNCLNQCIDGDCWDGKGTYRHYNDFTFVGEYSGNFKNGTYHEKGQSTMADGTNYDGEWKDGKRHGPGVQMQSDGATYIGNWKEDKFYEGEHKTSGGKTVTWIKGAPIKTRSPLDEFIHNYGWMIFFLPILLMVIWPFIIFIYDWIGSLLPINDNNDEKWTSDDDENYEYRIDDDAKNCYEILALKI